jgi:hypothetical protein
VSSYSWVRGAFNTTWGTHTWGLVDSLGSGITIRRIRFRWGLFGTIPVPGDMGAMASNFATLGFVTTVGDGTEVPPNPQTSPEDADPPLERWLYWETRAPIVTAVSGSAGVVAYRDSGSTEETSSKGQVLATGLPDGDSLNLWVSIGAAYDWDAGGEALLWAAWSLLISS